MMATVLLVALVQHPASPADTAGGRPCKMIIDSVGRQAQQVEVRRGETNVFAGGGVLAHCEGTSSTLASDSVAWFAGVKRFDMLGQKNPVHIRDTAMTLDATTAAYFMGQERLEATRCNSIRPPDLPCSSASPGCKGRAHGPTRSPARASSSGSRGRRSAS